MTEMASDVEQALFQLGKELTCSIWCGRGLHLKHSEAAARQQAAARPPHALPRCSVQRAQQRAD
jgi:hypothetical protein